MNRFWTSHTGPHMSLALDQNSQCTCTASDRAELEGSLSRHVQ